MRRNVFERKAGLAGEAPVYQSVALQGCVLTGRFTEGISSAYFRPINCHSLDQNVETVLCNSR